MKKALKFILPFVALLVAIVASYSLFLTKPKVIHQAPEIKIPLVSVAEVRAETTNIPVHTRGTVTPGTEIQLVSEVSGQVLELSNNFANGGFFRKDEILIKVDPIEYEVNIKRAEASKAQAYQAMLQADAERKARSRVKNTNKNQLATYDIQYQQAKAQYEATVAELEATKLQKARTIVRAPFDGRVRLAALNVGQFVRPGQQMGTIYAVDVAEIRLPLSDRQLSLVNVPMQFQENLDAFPEVIVKEEYAGKQFTWKGELVRAEGGLDERNRLLYVVARVKEPYSPDPDQPGRPELVAGSFVEAIIAGRKFERIFKVPRKALRNGSELWIVDNNGRLQEKNVGIIYKSKDFIFVNTGLKNGDRVVLNQMDIAVAGMEVRTEVAEEFKTLESSLQESSLFKPSAEQTEIPRQIKPKPAENQSSTQQEVAPQTALESLKQSLQEDNKDPVDAPKQAAEEVESEPNSLTLELAPEQKPKVAAQKEPKPVALQDPKVESEPRVEPKPKIEQEKDNTHQISPVSAPKPLKEASE